MHTLVSRTTFVDRLAAFGHAPALLSRDQVVSYLDLDARVEEMLARLGRERRLVLLHGRNTVDSVVTYLAALRGGHPVILVDGRRPKEVQELVDRFDPDLVIGPSGSQERRLVSRHGLHPDLRLLLSTSGSTGSPKLVRLSANNLESNAAAIAKYLGLVADDRAVTSLPLAYSYGLSVLHSHLAVGAGVVLTEQSVLEPEFWSLAGSHAVTSFAAVPHTFALLARTSHPWYAVPTLRYVTSAGGRLDPREVHRLSALGERHGWQLYVMYGQTEATARIAYLEPAEARAHPDCIGRAIPGGVLRVENPDAEGVGELVYSGPNVMMGYAQGSPDLASGPGRPELRTGDLGRQHENGLLQVVGRASRFAKLLGYRIDLDRVQSALTAFDPAAVCLSDDAQLLVAVTDADPRLVRDAAARMTGLPPGLVAVRQYPTIPLLPNGKPDLETLRRCEPRAGGARDVEAEVRVAYAEVLGYDRVDPGSSFVQLGGDSLSFVEMAFRLEELLGRLPDGWPELSIRELISGARTATTAEPSTEDLRSAVEPPAVVREPRPSGRTWAHLDTSLVLRALAIVAVVLAHVETPAFRGGAHLLLAVAGYTFARFPLAAVRESDRIGGLVRSIGRFAVPSVVFIGLVVAVTGGYSLANVALLNHLLGPPTWTETWNFWFIEVLVSILVVLAVLLAVPAVRSVDRGHPRVLPVAFLGVGLLLRPDILGPADATMRYGRPLFVFWLFALGWLIQVTRTRCRGRLLVSAVVLATLTGYFPDEPLRGLFVQGGLLLVIWLPTMPVPRPAAPVLRRVADSSLWVYLTHWVVWPPLLGAGLPGFLVVSLCLLAGVAARWAQNRLEPAGRRAFRLVHRWRPVEPAGDARPAAFSTPLANR